jgi:hypothetical protein
LANPSLYSERKHLVRLKLIVFIALACIAVGVPGSAQEVPYFVTYSHHMEEPGSLDIETKTATGKPQSPGHRFFGESTEFEYGTAAWWTTELYVDVTGTKDESTVLGGFRLENRIRPVMRELWINPVLYFEFEDINGANKSVLEVVGHDVASDFVDDVHETRKEKLREAELKLILSSDLKGWNVSENTIFEKNLNNSPWEFGYALGASRPLKLRASVAPCTFCLENLSAGAEMYGGLGDRYTPGLHNTSQYAGPVAQWQIPNGPRISFATGFGLNDYSLPHIVRIGVAYEFDQAFRRKGDSR